MSLNRRGLKVSYCSWIRVLDMHGPHPTPKTRAIPVRIDALLDPVKELHTISQNSKGEHKLWHRLL